MRGVPGLSKQVIRRHAAGEIFSRGESYAREGMVAGLTLRDGALEALVHGSQYEPYRVYVTFDAGGVAVATCTCPAGGGAWCKHIVAALLVALQQPESVQVASPLAALLELLDREQIQSLLLRLVARQPDLADVIAGEVAATQARATPRAAPTRPPVDVGPIQRQMRALLRASYRDYDDYYDEDGLSSTIIEGMGAILDQVRGFVEGGDSANALSLLDAITEECHASQNDFDDSYGALGTVLASLGDLWAEALLAADLRPDELEEWAEQLAEWAGDAADYGSDSGMRLAMRAAQEGWHDPQIIRALRGEPVLTFAPSAVEVDAVAEPDVEEEWSEDEDLDVEEEWDEEPPAIMGAPATSLRPKLALIRLCILERQERLDEYLNLAAAYGLHRERALMLAHLGRTEEAVKAGVETLASAADSLALATALREGGHLDAALQVAEHGLALDGLRGALGDWLASLAPGLGREDLALRAAEVACTSEPNMARYLAARDIAGAGWPDLRARLLGHLRAGAGGWMSSRAQAEIFLHESLIDDAIKVAERDSYGVLELVMDAAITARPQWVIKKAIAQAAPIMSGGKAQHYDRAVSWLRRARDAYRAAGPADDWERYLAGVRATHGRKYKLMGLIKGL
ncbi:SWIM zinc finger family protein [Candidatus Oscillochloris fontis]|uniref:SWIM zinc finger family protein n=1 Tax=Candidatus Oscillochloris fontis TaxID=2496868 RepID=UPI00101CB1BE|nr:SWIM zinc finger family protein [Candidatus Oscillochloris fontis]